MPGALQKRIKKESLCWNRDFVYELKKARMQNCIKFPGFNFKIQLKNWLACPLKEYFHVNSSLEQFSLNVPTIIQIGFLQIKLKIMPLKFWRMQTSL